MNEVKLRARYQNSSAWLYVSLPHGSGVAEFRISGEVSFGDKLHDWQQFTGLLDKEGAEIYEGDIVRSNLQNEMGSFQPGVAKVVWCGMNSCCGFHLRREGQPETEGYAIGTNCEVIGNIYENPELLTV